MTTTQDVAVTYTGTDDPFKDRIYRSGLTFTPGQTRAVPAPLAARFLQHQDVFKLAVAAKPAAAKKADATQTEPKPDAAQKPEDATQQEPVVDDTAALLDAAKKQEDESREKDDARFALIDSIESMDRAALIAWADQHYRQKIPANVSVAKARDLARGFIDQYGMPA